jgi:hypothetical protein
MAPDPTTLNLVLALALLATGAVLYLLPVGTCSECGHCKLDRLQKERELEARAARFYGIPECPACGRHHDPREDHPA